MTTSSEPNNNRKDRDNDFGMRKTDETNRRLGRSIVKRQLPAWFNPLNVITGLIIAVLMFAVFGTLSDVQIANQNQELIRIAINQNERQLQESKNIEQLLQSQGNISQDARAKIVNSIIKNEQELIPAINHTLISINETLANQANKSLQKDNNNKITETLNILRNQTS